MYRGFNMTNYYFAIYNFRNEKKIAEQNIKISKKGERYDF